MPDSPPPRGSFKHIGNKEKRQVEYRKFRSDKRKGKLARRMAQAKEERGPGGEEIKKVSDSSWKREAPVKL